MLRRFFIAAVVIGALFVVWFTLSLRPAGGSNVPKMITIEKGSGVSAIASKLRSEGVIRSPLAFRLYAKCTGSQGKLQAGTFSFSPSQSVSEILTTLVTGSSQEVSVTIPEGLNLVEIDALLAAKGLGKQGDVIDCAMRCDFSSFPFLPAKGGANVSFGVGTRLEGYLFPETYFVNVAEYVPKFFLERMLGEYRKRVAMKYQADIAASKRSLDDIVTMASLLEKESRKGDERSVVAGILWKREKRGTVLGVDATIRYVLSKWDGPLSSADLAIDSPFNTRTKRGLPPTPIANPGESAIDAALHPQESDYWYYLHGTDGTIHYARTNEEHNENRRRYLR